MHIKQLLIIIPLILFKPTTYAQDIIGFWKVDRVLVGNQNLTPVAKWFRFRDDHSYQSGNGWTQNDTGTWIYDQTKRAFSPTSNFSPKDPYGPFEVAYQAEKMQWKRQEDGMTVIVSLSSAMEMPMSPKDSISASWELSSVETIGGESKVPEGRDPVKMHIRKGETYHILKADSTEAYGYWHMDAHAPEFHLIDFDRAVPFRVFRVAFRRDQLILRPKENQNLRYIYQKTGF